MARSRTKDYPVKKQGDYRQTDTYLAADATERKGMNRYFRELELDPQQMYLIVRKRELDAVGEEEKKEANSPGQMFLILVALGFTASMSAASSLDVFTIISELVFLAAVLVVYFMGLLDRYKSACRKVNKMLKQYPAAPDMDEWIAQHPHSASSQQVESKKSRKKGKRRKKK